MQIMRSDAKKRGRGRPKIEIENPLDALNLREKKTQYSKSVKLRESTYNVLCDMRDHNDDIKNIDDVILSLIAIAGLVGSDK